jgi:hypothetical protein
MARRKGCVVSQAFEPHGSANRLGKRDKCCLGSRSRNIIAGNDGRPFRFQEQQGDLLEAFGIRVYRAPQLVRPDRIDRGLLLHHVDR